MRFDARVVEQPANQHAHPLRGVHHEADELARVLVEVFDVALLYQVDVAGYHPKRLLEVVRGDVGELLQLDVGARQFLRLPLQGAVGVYRFGVQQRVGERARHLRAYQLRRFHVARRVGGARQRAEVERPYHHVLVYERRA